MEHTKEHPMTATTMTLVEFLRARLDEDEVVALAACRVPEGRERTAELGGSMVARATDYPDAPLVPLGSWGWNGGPYIAGKNPDADRLAQIVGFTLRDRPDAPYRVIDAAVWVDDNGETEHPRALVPASEGGDVASHIARHDPARVLAEVEAKREIVDSCDTDGSQGPSHAVVCDIVLCALATIYRDHPDYRDEWRP